MLLSWWRSKTKTGHWLNNLSNISDTGRQLSCKEGGCLFESEKCILQWNLSDQIAQYLVSGLSTGAIYALIGIGFAIIYNSTEIINFAQGELVMLGGMFTLFFLNTAPSAAAAGNSSCRSCRNRCQACFSKGWPSVPLKSPTPLALIIITIGGSILIRGHDNDDRRQGYPCNPFIFRQ